MPIYSNKLTSQQYKVVTKIEVGELGIKAKNGLILPAGVFGRYEK